MSATRRKPWSRPATGPGKVRIGWTHADRRKGAGKFHVPIAIARRISPDAVFAVELTEDGVLFRYVEGQKPPPEPVELPAWIRGQ